MLAPRLTCGSMLEVSRDAVAAGEEQLVSCAAEQSKYCSICTVTLDPCGDLPFTLVRFCYYEWGQGRGVRRRWQHKRRRRPAGKGRLRLEIRISVREAESGKNLRSCPSRGRNGLKKDQKMNRRG